MSVQVFWDLTLCVNWLSKLLIFRKISSPDTLLGLLDFENECNGSYDVSNQLPIYTALHSRKQGCYYTWWYT